MTLLVGPKYFHHVFWMISLFTQLGSILCNKTSLTPIVLKGSYNKTSLLVNNTVEYIIIYDLEKKVNESLLPIRVSVSAETSQNVDLDFSPILVVVREEQNILSWQVPLSVTTHDGGVIKFDDTSRTLCPNNKLFGPDIYYHSKLTQNVSIQRIISISTASRKNMMVFITVEELSDMIITENVPRNISVSPSKPNFYSYRFSNATVDPSNYRTVVLRASSADNICLSISIQHLTCPVYDLEQEISFQGYYETMTQLGGITLSQAQFPNGFYVVFVVRADDSACSGVVNEKNGTYVSRVKNLTFEITPSISYEHYKQGIMYTVAFILNFYVFFLLVLCCCARRHHFRPLTLDSIIANDQFIEGRVDDRLPPAVEQRVYSAQAIIPASQTTSSIQSASTQRVDSPAVSCSTDDTESSLEDADFDRLSDIAYDKDVARMKPIKSLADLARKRTKVLRHQSHLYLWNILIVSTFYGLPVIQLVIRYQEVLNETGNQDTCYYNFLCAHPLGFLSDFNHVFSNVGYISFGVLFLFLTKRREKMHFDKKYEQQFGIPQHYGLFYTMGIALIMEGIVSGSYHVCPNHYNFQFDSSFMYIMATLCMVKLYQSRHPDINVRSHALFFVLAIVIFLGMVGILNGSVYFWIFFTVLHVTTCFILSFYIYHMGRFKLDYKILKRFYHACLYEYYAVGLREVVRPYYKHRLVMLTLMNIANWYLAADGLINHKGDFATHVLTILMGNAILYLMFYILMKLIHRETIQLHTFFYLLMATVLAGCSYYFFYHKTISWQKTPAESRLFNQPCRLFKFYDNHDIWHFLSALTMFFTFMVLLSLDDDLVFTARTNIAVF